MSDPPIEIVAAVLRDADGRVLTVRKQGAQRFMLPGGKREPGEADLVTLGRELREELGLVLVEASARRLGRFEAPAANEPGRQVTGVIYEAQAAGAPQVAAEIAEMRWLAPQPPYPVPLAPLLEHEVLPRLS